MPHKFAAIHSIHNIGVTNMHIWTIPKWQAVLPPYETMRHGLRLRCQPGVDPQVARACKEFAAWLRQEYHFPLRVVVYIKAAKQIKAMDGELVSATILLPYDRQLEPFARVSTGDYPDMAEGRGTDNALAAILRSIAHELTHYFQWINDLPLTDIGMERQAKAYADYIVDEYAQTRAHP